MMKDKFYITTAIAYTSGKPHIGNTYEIILSDAIARAKRQQGYDVFFMTGTDEHGEKIEQKANETGVSPKAFVDEVANNIQGLWDLMNISYDKFIRTTDAYHEKTVQKIFKKFYMNLIFIIFRISFDIYKISHFNKNNIIYNTKFLIAIKESGILSSFVSNESVDFVGQKLFLPEIVSVEILFLKQ